MLRFLYGLNDEYASVHSQILVMDPFPPLTKVYSMVEQHERQNRLGFIEYLVAVVNATEN